MKQGEKLHYMEVCNKGQVVKKYQKLLLIKGNQISQMKEFRLFYVWEDATVWAY